MALFSPPALRQAQARRAYVLLAFILIYFSYFCQPNRLDIHGNNRVGYSQALPCIYSCL